MVFVLLFSLRLSVSWCVLFCCSIMDVMRVLVIGLCFLGRGMVMLVVFWIFLVLCRMMLRIVLLIVLLGENIMMECISFVGWLN